MKCDFCEHEVYPDDHGVIIMHEKAPLSESMDDEIYNFCTYKCLKRWIAL